MDYSGEGTINGTDDISFQYRSTTFYISIILVLFIAIIAVTVPAVLVIITIVRKKDLHKYHYWFVANLMMCDILTAFTIAPLYIASYFLKVLNANLTMRCNVVFGIIQIPPICTGFMVVNSTIDAALAISYPLEYKNIMTKTKAVIMVLIAWILAASVTLPLIASPGLDVTVDDLSFCPYSISIFLLSMVVRLLTAFAIIGFNIYLYWVTFKTKWKLKSLVMDSSCPNGRVHSLRALLRKYESFIHLGVTLLLIIIVDGVLRIFRVLLVVFATYYGFADNNVYHLIFTISLWAEYVNHPVVYGLMLRQVHQKLCCNN